MGVLEFLHRWVTRSHQRNKGSRSFQTRPGLSVEELESRTVLYSASGNFWPSSGLVTISFMPDGTNLGGVTSNLNTAFNNKPSLAGRWQNEILRAAQVWGQQTNINFAVVSDNGAPSGSGSNQQGDPGFGDIRIGGYNFGSPTLARAYMPPAINNYSIAGDLVFNTGQNFNVGTTYDLFTVAMHEFGHAFGLDHTTTSSTSAMWASYNGVKAGLATDDINGIRNVYSSNLARAADCYEGLLGNNTLLLASNINLQIDPIALTALIPNADLTTSNDVDFYSVLAPLGTATAGGTMKVTVQSQGLSQLSANLTVYAADMITVLGSASGAGQFGSTLSVNLNNVSDLQPFFIKVQGGEARMGSWQSFNVGAYGMSLSFNGGPGPAITPPVTTLANGNPLSSGGGIAEGHGEGDDYLDTVPVITAVSPDTGASGSDRTTNSIQPTLSGSAPEGYTVQIYQDGNLLGSTVAGANTSSAGTLNSFVTGNTWSFSLPNPLANGMYSFTAVAIDPKSINSGTSDSFTVTIDTVAPFAPAVQGFSPDSGVVGDGITNCRTPTISGSAESFSTVTIYRNGQPVGSAAADSYGAWSYTVSTNLSNGTQSFTAASTDNAGNTSSGSLALNITIATQPPHTPRVTGISQDTGASATDGVTSDRTLLIYGKADANTSIQVFRNGVSIGTTAADSTGTWTFDYTGTSLADGTHVFTAKATDLAGNVTSLSNAFNVVVDTSVNSPIIAGVNKYQFGFFQTLVIQGTADRQCSIQVFLNGTYLGKTVTDDQGNWTYVYLTTSTLSGTYQLNAIATDLAGNAGTASTFQLLLGSTAPAVYSLGLEGSSSSSGWMNYACTADNTPTIVGTATAGSVVTILSGDVILGTTTTSATGSWTYTCPYLGDGLYAIRAEATNASGSTGLLSGILVLNIV